MKTYISLYQYLYITECYRPMTSLYGLRVVRIAQAPTFRPSEYRVACCDAQSRGTEDAKNWEGWEMGVSPP